MQTLNLIDKQSLPGRPVSRFLSKKEYRIAFPGRSVRRISFIFNRNRINKIENDIAFALISKYPSIKVVDRNLNILAIKDELDEMLRHQLVKILVPFGPTTRECMSMKTDELKRKIRKFRLSTTTVPRSSASGPPPPTVPRSPVLRSASVGGSASQTPPEPVPRSSASEDELDEMLRPQLIKILVPFGPTTRECMSMKADELKRKIRKFRLSTVPVTRSIASGPPPETVSQSPVLRSASVGGSASVPPPEIVPQSPVLRSASVGGSASVTVKDK